MFDEAVQVNLTVFVTNLQICEKHSLHLCQGNLIFIIEDLIL